MPVVIMFVCVVSVSFIYRACARQRAKKKKPNVVIVRCYGSIFVCSVIVADSHTLIWTINVIMASARERTCCSEVELSVCLFVGLVLTIRLQLRGSATTRRRSKTRQKQRARGNIKSENKEEKKRKRKYYQQHQGESPKALSAHKTHLVQPTAQLGCCPPQRPLGPERQQQRPWQRCRQGHLLKRSPSHRSSRPHQQTAVNRDLRQPWTSDKTNKQTNKQERREEMGEYHAELLLLLCFFVCDTFTARALRSIESLRWTEYEKHNKKVGEDFCFTNTAHDKWCFPSCSA